MAPDGSADRFGLELRYWRERQALSQSRLADLIGYSHGAISRLESGSRAPSRASALVLADALCIAGVDRLRFLSLAGVIEYPLDPDVAAVLCIWQRRGLTLFAE